MKFEDIQLKILKAPKLPFKELVDDTFNLFKKVWKEGAFMQFVFLIFSLPLLYILYKDFIDVLANENIVNMKPEDIQKLMVESLQGKMFSHVGITVLLGALQYVLYVGFIDIVSRKERGEIAPLSVLFKYFKKDYFGRTMLLMVVANLVIFLASNLFSIFSIYFVILLYFILPFLVFFKEFTIGQTLKLAYLLFSKKWPITLGVLVVYFILLFIGIVFTLGFGFILFSSVLLLPTYIVFKKVLLSEDN